MRSKSSKRRFHRVVILSLAVLSVWIQPALSQEQASQGTITVEEAVQMALEQNLELKVQAQDLAIVQGALITARVFLNPELELRGDTDAGLSNEGEGAYSVGLGQTFFVGPKRRYRIGIAELNIEKTRKAVENTRRLLVGRVKEAFYTVLLLQERRDLAEELMEINQRLVRLAEGRFREGFSPELDVGLARIQLQQARGNRTLIAQDLSVARASLNLFLRRPAQASLVAQGPFTEQEIRLDLSRLQHAAFTQRADLQGQKVALEIARNGVDLAMAERIPDVTLSLDYTQEQSVFSDFSDRDRLAGLKLSVPLPLFDRKQGDIARARAQQGKAVLELDLLRAVIEQETANATTQVQGAYRTLTLFREGILPLAEDHFRLTEAAYEQGQAGILDVAEAQRRLAGALFGHLGALFDYNLALVKMERVAGGHEGGLP